MIGLRLEGLISLNSGLFRWILKRHLYSVLVIGAWFNSESPEYPITTWTLIRFLVTWGPDKIWQPSLHLCKRHDSLVCQCCCLFCFFFSLEICFLTNKLYPAFTKLLPLWGLMSWDPRRDDALLSFPHLHPAPLYHLGSLMRETATGVLPPKGTDTNPTLPTAKALAAKLV